LPVPLPDLTHLQFLVLDLLIESESGLSASQLRESLNQHGEPRAGPKFYQLMKRLVKEGLIDTWSQSFDVGGGVVNRTYYKQTDLGHTFWYSTLRFYADRLRIALEMAQPKALTRRRASRSRTEG
jgi:hypothetical protein